MEIIVSQITSATPVTIFRPVGAINLGNVDRLTQKAQEAYDNGMRDLVLDMSDLDSMTSAGLRGINIIYRMLHSGSTTKPAQDAGPASGKHISSPHLKLLKPTPNVLRVLCIAGFDMLIEIYQDQQEALDAF